MTNLNMSKREDERRARAQARLAGEYRRAYLEARIDRHSSTFAAQVAAEDNANSIVDAADSDGIVLDLLSIDADALARVRARKIV